MKISNIKYLLFGLIAIASCNTAVKEESEQKNDKGSIEMVNKFSGHVYSFGPSIDTAKCEVIAECDCCADDFIFLNEKDFVRIGYCMVAKTLIKGTYSLDQNNVILHYDSLSHYTEADENNELKTIGKGKKEYLIKTDKNELLHDTISPFNCAEKFLYKNIRENSFGILASKDSIQSFIVELKKEGFWKKLNLN